jgi:hypothetical protein
VTRGPPVTRRSRVGVRDRRLVVELPEQREVGADGYDDAARFDIEAIARGQAMGRCASSCRNVTIGDDPDATSPTSTVVATSDWAGCQLVTSAQSGPLLALATVITTYVPSSSGG